MTRLAELRSRLKALEAEIAETEARLPAHSVKPPIMQVLIALEDQRDALIRQIETLAASMDPDGSAG